MSVPNRSLGQLPVHIGGWMDIAQHLQQKYSFWQQLPPPPQIKRKQPKTDTTCLPPPPYQQVAALSCPWIGPVCELRGLSQFNKERISFPRCKITSNPIPDLWTVAKPADIIGLSLSNSHVTTGQPHLSTSRHFSGGCVADGWYVYG